MQYSTQRMQAISYTDLAGVAQQHPPKNPFVDYPKPTEPIALIRAINALKQRLIGWIALPKV
jgi:hypothetical protein